MREINTSLKPSPRNLTPYPLLKKPEREREEKPGAEVVAGEDEEQKAEARIKGEKGDAIVVHLRRRHHLWSPSSSFLASFPATLTTTGGHRPPQYPTTVREEKPIADFFPHFFRRPEPHRRQVSRQISPSCIAGYPSDRSLNAAVLCRPRNLEEKLSPEQSCAVRLPGF